MPFNSTGIFKNEEDMRTNDGALWNDVRNRIESSWGDMAIERSFEASQHLASLLGITYETPGSWQNLVLNAEQRKILRLLNGEHWYLFLKILEARKNNESQRSESKGDMVYSAVSTRKS